jgi:hypothetical protein
VPLPFVELFFNARLASANHGLRYLGPTIRGMFGHVLKRTVCQMPHGCCRRCLLRPVCPYTTIFEGRAPEGRQVMRKYSTVPQPFVLMVAEPGRWWGGSSDLQWGLRLFGSAARFSPYVIEAFTRAGGGGVGPCRVPFEVLRVQDGVGGRVLWSAGEETMQPPQTRVIAPLAAVADGPLRWQFHTPVHLRDAGRERQRIDGLSIVLAGRRRAMLLTELFGELRERATENVSEKLDRREFVTRQATLRPWRIERFSGRQQRKVPLSGHVGEVVIEGPWSRAGAWMGGIAELHLGKYGSFGFGRVTWQQA